MERCGLKAAFAPQAASDATSRISAHPYAANAIAVPPPFSKGGSGRLGRCGLKVAFAPRVASDATSRISAHHYAADAVAVPPFEKGG